ncbi:hypothetical protein EUU23_10485 [Sphingorhabdus sp. IMCC26285]|uniref:Uncharacterized protein n=1 Tax=Sphingorhabdus profundilacus TaxID=2509718 RepID=A0A6I4LZ09_9SPHN|nr:hypothetical protein [Sphingorhabdus profundilacus]MVZ98119.1 hypothetical protein [Sphingorhabdus profundilacus]
MTQNIAPTILIANRTEKLHFLVEELALSAQLTSYATDSDMARMLARHVAIRIPEFICHLRQLRNCLPLSPASLKLKDTLNTFADEFDAHIAIVRNKLAAHVQDIDLVARTELWASIDASMVDYFVDGAYELWDSLGTLNAPGHQPFASPAALADPSVASALNVLAKEVAIPVTFGTDALAFARTNSSVLFNDTLVHQRAGQLALLRRWVRSERKLLSLFKQYAPIGRILKARLLTDIVSFHDCLITRPVQAGAPQEMDGLDALIAAAGTNPVAIQLFATSNRDDTTIDPIRHLRNRIGGHLEIDAAVSLCTLIAELDGFELAQAIRHYARLEATFIETCQQVHFLTTHLMDGQEVRGTLLKRGTVSPFDPSRPDIIAGPSPRPTYSATEMQGELERWEDGTGLFAAKALDYFRDAFSHAPLAETRICTEHLGSSKHFHHLEIRTSHMFIRDALTSCGVEEEEGLLTLISYCPGFPAELTEVMTDYHLTSGRPASPALLESLGRLAPWWHEAARTIVKDVIGAQTGAQSLLARAVLLRIYLRQEGPKRMNRQPSHPEWPEVKALILNDISAPDDLAALIVLASAFIGKDTGSFVQKFKSEYQELVDAVLDTARERLAGTLDPSRDANLCHLLISGQFAQAVQCIITTGPKGHAAASKNLLLHAFGHGLIETGRSAAEGPAVAELLLALDAREASLGVLESLCKREPGNVEYPLRLVEIVVAINGMAEYARIKIQHIREQFNLEAASEERLNAAERKLDAP